MGLDDIYGVNRVEGKGKKKVYFGVLISDFRELATADNDHFLKQKKTSNSANSSEILV